MDASNQSADLESPSPAATDAAPTPILGQVPPTLLPDVNDGDDAAPVPIAQIDAALQGEEKMAAKTKGGIDADTAEDEEAPVPDSLATSSLLFQHDDDDDDRQGKKKKPTLETGENYWEDDAAPDPEGGNVPPEFGQNIRSKLTSSTPVAVGSRGREGTNIPAATGGDRSRPQWRPSSRAPPNPSTTAPPVADRQPAREPPPADPDVAEEASAAPSLPMLEATLVVDPPVVPIYDAVRVTTVDDDGRRRRSERDDEEEGGEARAGEGTSAEVSWRRKRGPWIVVGALLLVVGALAGAMAVMFSSRTSDGGDGTVSAGGVVTGGDDVGTESTGDGGVASAGVEDQMSKNSAEPQLPTRSPSIETTEETTVLKATTGTPSPSITRRPTPGPSINQSATTVRPTTPSIPDTVANPNIVYFDPFAATSVRPTNPFIPDTAANPNIAVANPSVLQDLWTRPILLRDSFCENLHDLEEHMTSMFAESYMNQLLTNSYGCACTEVINRQFSVDCMITYFDGDQAFFNKENIVMEDQGGSFYALKTTTWNDSSMSAVTINQGGGSTIKAPQEVFNFVDGVLTSCSAYDCASCTVCDDRRSVVIECGAKEYYWAKVCEEGYSGSFANTFDFPRIRVRLDGLVPGGGK